MNRACRPFLRWLGGKRRFAAEIDAAFRGPCEGTYYEPFLGGGAVALYRLQQGTVKRAVLSDRSPRLINAWQMVRDYATDLVAALADLPQTVEPETFKRLRQRYNHMLRNLGPAQTHLRVEQAALLIWLNFAGFNGIYRENARGDFNAPPGVPGSPVRRPSADDLFRCAELLRGRVDLFVWSFTSAYDELQVRDVSGCQVYADPPYASLLPPWERVRGRGAAEDSFVGYGPGWEGDADHRQLAVCATEAASRGVRTIVSNHWSENVALLYPCPPWRRDDVLSVHRTLGGTGTKTGHRVNEVLLSIG